MQGFKIALCVAAFFGVRAEAQVTNIVTEGNLEVTHEFGCMPLSEAKASYTPPDFLRAMLICANDGDYDTGISLFGAALFYGMHDRDRVADPTARQGLTVLIDQTLTQMSPTQKDLFKQSFDTLTDTQSDIHTAFCRDIKRLGKPDYFPRYMVQHGMAAVMGRTDAPLIEDFPEDENWADILRQNGCV